MNGPSTSHPVFEFYCDGAKGPSGRTIDDVLAFTVEQLEVEHEYIQWLFPSKEESKAVPSSPVTCDDEVGLMLAHPQFLRRYKTALRKMLGFYGLSLESQGDQVMVTRSSSYDERSALWLHRPHNFKRLSRILGSLRLFGMDAEANALRLALEAIYERSADKVDPATRVELDKSLRFWKET